MFKKPISYKASQFTESVIREMTRLAMEHQAINLSQGFPDFAAPDVLKKAAADAIFADLNQYAITWGAKNFRDALVYKTKKFMGIDIDPEREITVSCGSTEAMIDVLLAVINPADEVVVFEPFYENYGPDAIISGATPRYVQLRRPDWSFDEKELAAAFNNHTKAIIINTPNNPTGKVFSREELRFIADLCQKWDVLAITDEIYEHIIYDGLKQISIATLDPALKARSIVVNGFSKAYAMTGWRLGYCAGPREVIEMCDRLQSQTTSNATAFAQVAGIEALTGPQESVGAMAQAFEERRNFVVQRLNAIHGITCNTPRGAFYIFPNIAALFGRRAQGQPLTTAAEVADYLLEAAGVAVVPGDAFGDDHYMRISYASSMAELEDGLARIDQAVQQLA